MMNKKTLAMCVAAAALFTLPLTASAQLDKLVVKDPVGTPVFVVQDSGNVGVGSATPTIPMHISTENVGQYLDAFGNNITAGTAADIRTTTGTPPGGAIQAISNEFLIRYAPGVAITNNFNTFRMIARTDSTTSDNFNGHVAAANFISQHQGTGTANLSVGFITNVANRSSGTITSAEAIRAATPSNLGGGTIVNAYGIHIQPQGVTGASNPYGIFQEGAGDSNYLAGNTGIGTETPTHLLELSGGAYSDGATWDTGSSRTLKENIKEVTADEAMAALEELNPVQYNYKKVKDENRIGFIAEDVPELVAMNSRKAVNGLEITAVLTKVVKEQQKVIVELQEKLAELEQRTSILKPRAEIINR